MNLLFGLMGAVLGGLLGNLPTALCMALAGAVVGWRWRAGSGKASAPHAEFDAATLLGRVVALEREVVRLRGSVAQLRSGEAAADAPSVASAPPPFTATHASALPVAPAQLVEVSPGTAR